MLHVIKPNTYLVWASALVSNTRRIIYVRLSKKERSSSSVVNDAAKCMCSHSGSKQENEKAADVTNRKHDLDVINYKKMWVPKGSTQVQTKGSVHSSIAITTQEANLNGEGIKETIAKLQVCT